MTVGMDTINKLRSKMVVLQSDFNLENLENVSIVVYRGINTTVTPILKIARKIKINQSSIKFDYCIAYD